MKLFNKIFNAAIIFVFMLYTVLLVSFYKSIKVSANDNNFLNYDLSVDNYGNSKFLVNLNANFLHYSNNYNGVEFVGKDLYSSDNYVTYYMQNTKNSESYLYNSSAFDLPIKSIEVTYYNTEYQLSLKVGSSVNNLNKTVEPSYYSNQRYIYDIESLGEYYYVGFYNENYVYSNNNWWEWLFGNNSSESKNVKISNIVVNFNEKPYIEECGTKFKTFETKKSLLVSYETNDVDYKITDYSLYFGVIVGGNDANYIDQLLNDFGNKVSFGISISANGSDRRDYDLTPIRASYNPETRAYEADENGDYYSIAVKIVDIMDYKAADQYVAAIVYVDIDGNRYDCGTANACSVKSMIKTYLESDIISEKQRNLLNVLKDLI